MGARSIVAAVVIGSCALAVTVGWTLAIRAKDQPTTRQELCQDYQHLVGAAFNDGPGAQSARRLAAARLADTARRYAPISANVTNPVQTTSLRMLRVLDTEYATNDDLMSAAMSTAVECGADWRITPQGLSNPGR